MILRASVCALVLSSLAFAARAATEAEAQKIAPWVLQKTEAGQQAEFLLVLGAQADLARAARLTTKAEKGRFVYETLFGHAQETQAALVAELRARGVEHRSFYIVNAIWVKGDRKLALDMAARADVARVEGNPVVRNVLGAPDGPQDESRGNQVLAIEEGIAYVRAPDVWALGFTGQGIVVGGNDTGQRWTHNALKPRYRGWNGTTADHNFNWHDSIHVANAACLADSVQPCDDNGHGSHTIGTAVGDDNAGNQVGVAPGAKWIGCRNMNAGNGTPATYIECFEWFLAPYPVGGTPAQGDSTKAPDVTVNSWGCPTSEGCSANTLLAAIQAQRAAGIVTEVSAGNAGSGCSTVNDPPAIYDESFGVGALSCAGNVCTDSLASFSSRGLVTLDASNRIKPDIAAPGTSVRSASGTSDTSYASLQGTSMSGPHVGGAVALLLSAVPSLSGDVAGIEARLTSTAVRNAATSTAACSSTAGVYPNNLFGYGRLNALCAVRNNLAGVSIGVAGATTIGAPAPCVGGTATVTDTGGGVSAHQWGYRTTTGGPITDIAGQTGTTYALTCSHFPSPGTYRLVERTTPQCGVAAVSNEIVVTVDSTPVGLQTLTIE